MYLQRPMYKFLQHVEYMAMLRAVSQAVAPRGLNVPQGQKAMEEVIKAWMNKGHERAIEHAWFSVEMQVDQTTAAAMAEHRTCAITRDDSFALELSSEKGHAHVAFIIPDLEGLNRVGITGGFRWVYLGEGKSEADPKCALVADGEPLESGRIHTVDDEQGRQWLISCQQAEFNFLNYTLSRKPTDPGYLTPEAAAIFLTNSVRVGVTISANMREWRHIFQKGIKGDNTSPQVARALIAIYEEALARFPIFFEGLF